MISASCTPATLMVIDPWTGGREARLRRHHTLKGGVATSQPERPRGGNVDVMPGRQVASLPTRASRSFAFLRVPISAVPRYAVQG